MTRDDPQVNFRMPKEMKEFIADQARRNRSSQNSEVIRCVRERMDRVLAEQKTA